MADIKTRVQGIEPFLKARDVEDLASRASNTYEALNIIEKRARQLNMDLKVELHAKLDEFAVSSETIEEIQENKEQIEISKFYEKLPNPTVIATNEFLNHELEFRYKEQTEEVEE
jgi:DNA-directed RNA polymerase subunit K/omega